VFTCYGPKRVYPVARNCKKTLQQDAGAMAYTTIVAANASDSCSKCSFMLHLQGMAIAEYFRDPGTSCINCI